MSSRPAILGNPPIFDRPVPLVRPWLPDYAALEEEMRAILGSGIVTKGTYLREFETAVSHHLNVQHAVATSSCTTGLMLTYQGLDLHGEVVVPGFTFMATVSALVWTGLRPVFADVEPGTTNLSPAAAEAAITPNTSALVAVHNFGNPADSEAFQSIARRHGIKLIFDAAHGFGAQEQGIPVGSQGDASVFSLSPTKLLVTGEGGIVATNDEALAAKVRMGREYGNNGRYDSAFAGINARLTEFGALLGLHGLPMLEDAVTRRNAIAALYRRELEGIPGLSFQEVRPGNRCSYKDFCILIDPAALGLSRDELSQALKAENVDVRHYYDPPVHRHTAYHHLSSGRALPVTDWLSSHIICLPIWSHMSDEVALGICHAIQRIAVHASVVHTALSR